MAGPNLPETPAPLKNIQPYLKTATEHDQRDPVISYWCRLYALQTGLKLVTKTSEETNFLIKLMDWLEATKKAHHDNEAITNDIAAQAHIENWALKIFLYADKNDRASNFGKNVIQSFYTAGLLYDVLTTFGDLSEEAGQNRKYAKWKAAYIHNCLKNGETPVPGPLKDEKDDLIQNNSNENDGNNLAEIKDDGNPEKNEDTDSGAQSTQSGGPSIPMQPMMPMHPKPPSNIGSFDFPSVPAKKEASEDNEDGETQEEPAEIDDNEDSGKNEESEPHPYNPAPTPTNPGANNRVSYEDKTNIKSEEGIELSAEQSGKAQKYIKWAGSALNYDDVPTAILNLRKALHLLTTGEDPA